ncbi:WXG100 family type VII secretion target [Catenuloplanes nepalensis]|uniref:ESAT-6-like protein n=1 Tax=Catenuloplanes nepalensis TaxID=587533 RepID=A0ABT9N5A9_9ACTN|nr:WXG100 family type VII secretion target [Catenuloplanes nepalensis]MDP9798894.1 WXG100 family type VII secretion target [Catenuloplanes nepalensis]
MIVDVVAVRRMGAEITATAVALRSALDDLDERTRLPAEAWGGEARHAFAERRDAWRRAADDLTALLREIGREVDDAAADYLATESRNRALFGP